MSLKILVGLTFVLMLLLTTICFAEASENKFVLQRIKAEEGDGSEVKVMLRTGRFAKGVIYDMSAKNVKGDFVQEAPREMIIVSNGLASIITKDQKSLVIGNEFLVDNSLLESCNIFARLHATRTLPEERTRATAYDPPMMTPRLLCPIV